MIKHRIIETLQLSLHSILLVFLVNWRYTSMLKGEFILQCLFDEKGLTNTPPAIHSNEFRTITLVKPF